MRQVHPSAKISIIKGKSPQATAPGTSHKKKVLKGNYKILANKVQFLKYSVDGFREAVEELQLNIDILEKADKMYQDVYDTLELQIDDLRGKLNAVLKQLPGAKKAK